jgi:hypothetical protein
MPTNVKNFFPGFKFFYPLKIYSYIPNAVLWIRKEFFRIWIHKTAKKATFYSPPYILLSYCVTLSTYLSICTSYQGKVFVVTGTGDIQQKQYRQHIENFKFSFPYSTYNLNLPCAIICPTSFSNPDSDQGLL